MASYLALNKSNNFQDYINHYVWILLYATAYETALEKKNENKCSNFGQEVLIDFVSDLVQGSSETDAL